MRRSAASIRERQDLVAEWRDRDRARTAAVAQAPYKRDRQAEAENAARLADIDTRTAEIDRRLAADFPDYAAFAHPTPFTVEQARAELRADEALVFFLDTSNPEETFVWVITKTAGRWVRSEFGTPSLRREVAALRCGLDATAWHGEGAAKCAETPGIGLDKVPAQGERLPFDHARAHKVYKALFGEVEDLVAGKHLLVVPSGPLTQLPFQVLLTAPSTNDDHKVAAWLARSHAVTVLPAVSSLNALRRVAKPSGRTRTFASGSQLGSRFP